MLLKHAALQCLCVGVDREETAASAAGGRQRFSSVRFRLYHFPGLHLQPDQLWCEREHSLPRTTQNGTLR